MSALELIGLFAEAGGAAAPVGPGPGQPTAPGWTQFVPMIAILFILYFVMFLPMRKQKQQMAQMMSTLEKGKKVLTSSGIIGYVVNIKEGEDELTLRSDDTKLRVLRSSVIRVYADDAKPSDTKA